MDLSDPFVNLRRLAPDLLGGRRSSRTRRTAATDTCSQRPWRAHHRPLWNCPPQRVRRGSGGRHKSLSSDGGSCAPYATHGRSNRDKRKASPPCGSWRDGPSYSAGSSPWILCRKGHSDPLRPPSPAMKKPRPVDSRWFGPRANGWPTLITECYPTTALFRVID